MENEIQINLTKDEALVLFEFLSGFNQMRHNAIFEDQAEQKALWTIEKQLERILAEPFRPDYLDIIKEARNRLKG